MNVLLWVLQCLLAALFLLGGGTKVFLFEKISQVPSSKALPHEIWTCIGIFEVLCSLAFSRGEPGNRGPRGRMSANWL